MSKDPIFRESSLPPSLSSADFVLRPFLLSDANDWSAYLSDPLVTLHTSWNQVDPTTIESVVRRLMAEYSTGTSCRLVVARSRDNRLVGTCGFKWWSPKNLDAEIVYDLAREYWQRGIMSDTVETVVDWAFSDVGLKRVEALVMTTNRPSIALLERCGFKRESLLRKYRVVQGAPHDFYMYSRCKEP